MAEEDTRRQDAEAGEAMEEDVEQEGYGQCAARVSTVPQSHSHSMLTRLASVCTLSFVHSDFFIDMDKLVLRTARS